MYRVLNILTTAFPLWILIGCTVSLIYPPVFTWFQGPMITYGLGIIMLGMGITLKMDDFKNVLITPGWIFAGILLQYTVMPAMGWFAGWLFKLPTNLAVGLIIVSCCPGGTASNVIAYIARARVALSVSMTAISTILAIVLTPILTSWIIGSRIAVDPWALFFDTIKVVLFPIVLGVLLNQYFPRLTKKMIPFSPFAAVIAIVLIVSSIVGAGKHYIFSSGWQLMGAVFTLHASGFLFAYVFSRIFFKDRRACQTISIEVGMQNSGLGVVLARNNFASPLTSLAPAISSAMHSLIGSLLSGIWRIRNKKEEADN